MSIKTMILDWAYPTIADDYRANNAQWREISERCFDHFLEVVPPLHQSSLGLVCSEPYLHTDEGYGVYTCCLKRFDGQRWRYFAKLATLAEFERDRLNFEIPDAAADEAEALTQQWAEEREQALVADALEVADLYQLPEFERDV